MHRKKLVFRAFCFALAAIIALELFALSVPAQEAGLSLVHVDIDRDWYVNSRTLVRPGTDRVSFWNKIVPTKGSSYLQQVRGVLKQAGKHGSRMEYLQALQEVDCRTGQARTWSILFYDRQDRIIHMASSPKDEVVQAALGAPEEQVRDAVCSSGQDDRTVRIARLITGPGEE